MAVATGADGRVYGRRAWGLVAVVGLGAAALGTGLLASGWQSLEAHWLAIAVLCTIGLMTTVVPPRIPWVRIVISGGTLPILIGLVLFGPAAAFVIGVVGTMIVSQLRRRLFRAFLYNRATLGLAAGLAGVVFRTLVPSGHPLLSVAGVGAAVLALFVFTLANQMTLALYIAMLHGSRVTDEAASIAHEFGALAVGVLLLGPLVVACYHYLHVDGLVFLVLPVAAINLLLGRYQAYTKAFLDGVETLATALGAKDQVTLDHSRRVGEYASQIARRLHMSETQVGIMYYNGLLHDAGKLGVCDDLLKKPAAFTPDEYEQIKVHAALGEQFTEPFWKLDRAIRRMNYVSYHHERWDGRGYPRGLSRDEIPLGGRILAVADAYDAMTQDRPYHQGVGAEIAYKELIRCAGAQFDPVVVRAFLESQGATIPATFERRVRAQELMAERRDIVNVRSAPVTGRSKA